MDVNGVGSVHGAYPVRSVPAGRDSRPADAAKPVSPQDEVEISSAGRILDQLSNSSEVRQERLAQIKEAIENGSYDSDEKLEAALARMLDQIGHDLDD